MVNDVIAAMPTNTKQLQWVRILSMENCKVGRAMFTNEG